MQIKIELKREDLIKLVKAEIKRQLGGVSMTGEVKILTKSKHNWKAEWEEAEYQAIYICNT